MGLELVEQEISDWQKVKFISTGDGYYVMSFKGGGDGKRVQVIGRGSRPPYIMGLELVGHPISDWQKVKLISTDEKTNTIIHNAHEDWQAIIPKINQAKEKLKLLNASLTATPADKAAWDAHVGRSDCFNHGASN
ncbi:MAG UNVERIFIED_CONTAM: hypothetical protein LVR29_03535 [Microcystis novacekii LVE1205-3]|jgi:hypothetical protein